MLHPRKAKIFRSSIHAASLISARTQQNCHLTVSFATHSQDFGYRRLASGPICTNGRRIRRLPPLAARCANLSAMKTLILMRHAKSAWDDPHHKDIDRPLSPRGRKVAPRMGEWLAGEGYKPHVVLCSSAQRTRETLDLIRPHLPQSAKIEFAPTLYLAAPREMLTEIGKLPATAE